MENILEDTIAKWRHGKYVISNSFSRREIFFEDNKVYLKSFINLEKNFNYISGKISIFKFIVNGETYTSLSKNWSLKDININKHNNTIELTFIFHENLVEVKKTYIIYPYSSIIREKIIITNISPNTILLEEPSFLTLQSFIGKFLDIFLYWMSGGENVPGSWTLQSEPLFPNTIKIFDSYQPQIGFGLNKNSDGVKIKILKNNKQIWPRNGWIYSHENRIAFSIPVKLKENDRIYFIVNANKNSNNDRTEFNPIIVYDDGETYNVSSQENWLYMYFDGRRYFPMIFDSKKHRWFSGDKDGLPWISSNFHHPKVGKDSVSVFIAPKNGYARIVGYVINIGDEGGRYKYRMGSASYAPFLSFYNHREKHGIFVGWDYFGHWIITIRMDEDNNIYLDLKIPNYRKILKTGESVELPLAFTGTFTGDLDNMGEQFLEWQYRYLWDYTREEYFAKCIMEGDWLKGQGDFKKRLEIAYKVYRIMEYCGADIYHEDYGWWDQIGDWNGPDFSKLNNLLHKSGKRMIIYLPIYNASPKSKIVEEHKEWCLQDPITDFWGGIILDQSKQEVVEWELEKLSQKVREWGAFQWRNDGDPLAPNNEGETILLEQDRGFRKLLKSFLDRFPDCAIQTVNHGGHLTSYEYLRYSSGHSFSDGAVGEVGAYYISHLFPPDKLHDIPENSKISKADKSYRRLLEFCGEIYIDTDNPSIDKLNIIRQLFQIYHYLKSKGVVGRWVRIYHPKVEGDNPIYYIQRLSHDRERGIIIIKRRESFKGRVKIYPKGLIPNLNYHVSFQEIEKTYVCKGYRLMKNGITLTNPPIGELIYLNLPDHP